MPLIGRVHRIFFYLTVCGFFLSFFDTYAQSVAPTDSITVKIAPDYDAVRKFHRFLFGESYRKLWAAPVKVRILSLEHERGGLTVLQKGGGMQTRSLRLRDPQGKEWVLRTIQKYPERGLPENLSATVARDILQDQVSASHPFAPLTVPPLADALGIPHSNPEIVYIAEDPGLGEYSQEFANSVYLFEEREPLDAGETENTGKVQRELQEDNDHLADQKLVLRARLLDMLLGDWDRHEDQWRWQEVKEKGETVYSPVPRDRDNVYYKTSGLLPWIVSHQWLKTKFQGYDHQIRDIKGWNFNARFFDRYFLNGLSEKDWKEQIAYVQHRITDDLIRQSLSRLPDTIYALSGAEIGRKMRSRRNALPKQALEYYHFLAKTVEIPASDKPEFFKIEYQAGGDIEVEVSNIRKDGSKGRKVFDRTFKAESTREIRMYGFKAKNVFNVEGNNPSVIRVRMIGGPDSDSFYIDRQLHQKSKITIYDRPYPSNILPSRKQAKIRLSTDSAVHDHNKLGFKYDRLGPLVQANYTSDLGLLLRLGAIVEKQGFRKAPYAMKHTLWASYSTQRRSFRFDYSGEFKAVPQNSDLSIDIVSKGPGNVSNFFGIGNETLFADEGERGIEYYRNRYDQLNGEIKLHQYWSNGIKVNAGLAAEHYNSSASNNETGFFNEYDLLRPEQDVFAERFFAGLVVGAKHDTRMGDVLSWGGVTWDIGAKVMRQLNGNNTYGRVSSNISFYTRLFGDTTFVMANRIGGGTTFGEAAFFQQMQLGGIQNLRGFHTNRFTGKTMLYHNFELRAKLLDFTSYIAPGSIGLIGFNDVGRVWVTGEHSKKWHHGYGGGMYIIPAELILLQALVGFSEEGTQPYISIGFNF